MTSFHSGWLGQFFYNLYTRLIGVIATIWSGAGTCDLNAKTRFLVTAANTFITDGVAVGDLVRLTVGGEYALVVEVISETMLYTAALSSAGTYDSGEAFTITRNGVQISAGTVAATDPCTIFLHDVDGDFIDAGVCVADVVTMTVGGETASVVGVHETFLHTTTLSGAGTYANAEAFTIANDVAKVIRVVCPRATGKQTFLRKISSVSDLSTARIAVLLNSSNTPIYQEIVGTTKFVVEPPVPPQADNTPIIVEMTYTTVTNLFVNCAYEQR